MEKFVGENCEVRTRRNTSFCKTSKLNTPQEFELLPSAPLHQIKTVKIINKKESKIPFLNLANLRPLERPKVLSLNHKYQEKVKTDRQNTHQSEGNVSFFLNENILKATNKKQLPVNQEFCEKTKKSCIFPPIVNQGFTTPVKFGKQILMREKSHQSKRKKSRMNIHCKVLLSKNSHFPFMGSNLHELKKTQISKTKQTQNPQHIELFDLDISRIIEIPEPISPAFISKESFQQIAIF